MDWRLNIAIIYRFKFLLKLHSKSKSRTPSFLRCKVHLSSQLWHDLLWDHQPKANAIDVSLLGILDKTKQFEKLRFVLVFYPQTCVDHFDFEELVFLLSQNSNTNLDRPSHSKLKCIRLKIQNHLHNPVFVRQHDRTKASQIDFFCWNRYVFKSRTELDVPWLRAHSLNRNDFFNNFANVKGSNIDSEFSCLELGEVKEVRNNIGHQICWWFLNFHCL